MQRITERWRVVVSIALFCLLFGGTALTPMTVGATGTYVANTYQGSVVYLPPSPCRGYYAAY
jgi:hypothetical protein